MVESMRTQKKEASSKKGDVDRVADFIMFTQRSFLLNLSRDLNRGNVSYAQFFLLGYLANEDYLSMTDIAKKMGHSTAAATGLVDRLEKLGYVERVHAADDRRKVMVEITSKGRDLVKSMRQGIVKNLADVMATMDEGERDEILGAAEQVS
ncbi:hypothetical protein BH23VER1_BH23VER1_08820 [soil metagenome]